MSAKPLNLHACPMCRPELWDGALVVVPDAQFCGSHKGHAVAWLFRRLNLAIERDGNGVAKAKIKDDVEVVPTRLAA